MIQCGCDPRESDASWGRRRRAEAEMGVAFVYHNALYLLSCKNDHLTDRFFSHLDRFCALTAEFCESRTGGFALDGGARRMAHSTVLHGRDSDAGETGARQVR
jgi:hypothetical protein